jgi:hypothetical protein
MSWGAQNRSEDAKTPSVGLAMLIKPELDCCPVQPYLSRILNPAADVVPISRLCRSLILKRRERRHIARRCSVHKSVMDEPSAAVSTSKSKSDLNNIWSQYSDVAISTSLQPLGSVLRATHPG